MFHRLLFAGLLLTSCTAPRPPREEPHTLPLKPYAGRLRMLELSFPRRARVLFDTGGGLTILAPEAAAQINCEPYSRVTGLRMNGQRFDFDTCGQATISFGPLDTRPEIAVFDLMTLLPEGLPRIDGLASLQTFSDSVLVVDLGANQIEVHASLPDSVTGMREVPIRLGRCCSGMGLDAFVQIQGSKGPLWFELDSGNLDDVLIPPRTVDQLGLSEDQSDSLSKGSPTDISIPIAGLGNVNVTARTSDIIYDGALNAEFFERNPIVLDLPNGRGWLEKKQGR